MEKYAIKSTLQVNNFIYSLEEEGDRIVLTTVPTEQNDGGCVLAIYSPLQDRMLYGLIRASYDLACDGDENAKSLLLMKAVSLNISRSIYPLDALYVNRLADITRDCYGRIKSFMDSYGNKESEDDALAELAEREEMEDKLREYEKMVSNGKDK